MRQAQEAGLVARLIFRERVLRAIGRHERERVVCGITIILALRRQVQDPAQRLDRLLELGHEGSVGVTSAMAIDNSVVG